MTETSNQQNAPVGASQSNQNNLTPPPDNTLRGCLTLSALVVACAVITIACLLLFTKPVP